MVAMNSETYAADVREVVSGAICSTTRRGRSTKRLLRSDITFLGVPFARMCTEAFAQARERILMKNIVYVGNAGGPFEHRYAGWSRAFSTRNSRASRPSSSRITAPSSSATSSRWITSSAPCPFASRRWTPTKDSILIDGKHGHGSRFASMAGATVAAWYPITPATSVMDAFKQLCNKYRRDPEDR